jgi:hypothetical protein
VQAIGLVGGTVALAVVWAMRGWSVERDQTLGIIWLGLVIALAMIAMYGASLNRAPETLPERAA